jgi:hypothetical protein
MDTFVEMDIQFAGWVAKLVALLLATEALHSFLGSNPDIFQKYKMGDISKGSANTL